MRSLNQEELDLCRDSAIACGYKPVEHHAREFTAIHIREDFKQRFWNPLDPKNGQLAELMSRCSIELYTDWAKCNCVEAKCFDYYYGYSVAYGVAVVNGPDNIIDQDAVTRELRTKAICEAATLAAAMKTRFGRNKGGQPTNSNGVLGVSGYKVMVCDVSVLEAFVAELAEQCIPHGHMHLDSDTVARAKAVNVAAPFSEELTSTAIYFHDKFDIEDAVLTVLERHQGSTKKSFPFNFHDYLATL